MELSPSWEAASRLAIQELPNILRKPEVYLRVHKGLALTPILSHTNPVITTLSYSSKINLNITLAPRSGYF
jgi:hypothetical protein